MEKEIGVVEHKNTVHERDRRGRGTDSTE